MNSTATRLTQSYALVNRDRRTFRQKSRRWPAAQAVAELFAIQCSNTLPGKTAIDFAKTKPERNVCVPPDINPARAHPHHLPHSLDLRVKNGCFRKRRMNWAEN